MGSLAPLDPTIPDALWETAARGVNSASNLEAAASAFLDAIYSRFDKAMILARTFVTIPYGSLPKRNAAFVKSLGADKRVAANLNDSTPVLSLIGSRGQEPTWNDIRKSEGHVGIPLVSAQFVDAIPMVARLLADLDLGVDLGVRKGATESETGPSFIRTFYVEDATTTTDEDGRKIIAMQDFVQRYHVRTVFGGGGPYRAGSPHIVACIFFTRESIEKDTAYAFEPLLGKFRDATRHLVDEHSFFGPE